MALPPTIPTSFVPKQPVIARRAVTSFNPFLFVSYVIFGVWALAAGALFGYQLFLEKSVTDTANKVAQAQSNIDQATVDEFIRTRDRFTFAKDVLDKHIILSKFFGTLEDVTIQNARYSKLKITILDARNGKIEISGTAKNFNALAAQSNAYTESPYIKNAIFSGFQLDQKSGTVTFQITGDVDPALVQETQSEASAPDITTTLPAQTSQPAPTTTQP